MKPMTFEEAVALTRTYYRRLSSLSVQEAEDLDRADLVINAAIRTHKARRAMQAAIETVDHTGQDIYYLSRAWHTAEDKLRALEQGKDV
jgi:hypothetical protein